MFSPIKLRKINVRNIQRAHNDRTRPIGGYVFHFLLIFSTLLLNIGSLLGGLLILICGSAQYGLSMLASVVQGTITVLLSLEIKSSIKEKIFPSRQVQMLAFLGILYTIHFATIISEGEKCNSLCQNYFDQIQDRNIISGKNSSSTQVFTDKKTCISACQLSMQLFEYSLGATGSLHLVQCTILWILSSCSTTFISTSTSNFYSSQTG